MCIKYKKLFFNCISAFTRTLALEFFWFLRLLRLSFCLHSFFFRTETVSENSLKARAKIVLLLFFLSISFNIFIGAVLCVQFPRRQARLNNGRIKVIYRINLELEIGWQWTWAKTKPLINSSMCFVNVNLSTELRWRLWNRLFGEFLILDSTWQLFKVKLQSKTRRFIIISRVLWNFYIIFSLSLAHSAWIRLFSDIDITDWSFCEDVNGRRGPSLDTKRSCDDADEFTWACVESKIFIAN